MTTTGMALIDSIRKGAQVPPSGIVTLKLNEGHNWIKSIGPGSARFTWTADPAYYNAEGSIICSWIAALIDQAVFYASNTLVDGNGITRVESLHVQYFDPVKSGSLDFIAQVEKVQGQTISTVCDVRTADGALAARAAFVSSVIGGRTLPLPGRP